ncbi:hypothetical protein GCM10025882_31900 [Acinetobacter gyllenbergii]|uniref:DUF2280 domain-containing protein n=1 Tax=Acinetobacter gyllenbergii CIP 110306 = MTCC 11365 TaxID=1217657 RepID=A0A829HCP4_9GAMM|nr:DUF2280 domain-containing protein [Acinetobacter gyllenbergii]EPF72564.1 hypothetical protein F957_03700 [Acinetobacter gyllenbergii CIP 110306 = MTCC 11365]EPH31089.1 hypothetical protein L293_2492 [Acinetobacter gyllenbergii CIP 110306 = MTCC 11365]GMA12765.1 hypothetical protein GCM10025882_31900 [Acinetobacter gyllenbergii]
MAKLKKAEQLYIVRSLAQFMTPTEVVKDIKEKFNIDVSPQQVEAYDPNKVAGRDLRKEFRDVFEATRKEYLEQPLSKISGANDIVQLKILNDLLWSKKNNVKFTLQIVEQMQKIMKGFYDKKGGQPTKGSGDEAGQTKADVELEIKKLELQKLQREVNPPEHRPPDEDYKIVLNPDEEIPNEPIL